MPKANYMDSQTELTWAMRSTLIDWLLQVHLKYHMLPETLWIAINIIDRFLSVRIVSTLKLQLVGVTAMLIAAKYEEIMAPSVEEFVFMTEQGYTKDEILKGECIILQSLDFQISHYCSPYSWMRRISKADDYDLQTRTLGKFLIEVTLLDHRFLRAKSSLIAAVGMYSARAMLGGDWVSFKIPDRFLFPRAYPLSFLFRTERGLRLPLRLHRGATPPWSSAHRREVGREKLHKALPLQEVRQQEVPEGFDIRRQVGQEPAFWLE